MANRASAWRIRAVPPLDVLLALVLTALCLVEIWVEPIFQTGLPGPRAALSVVVIASGAALAVRNTWPLAALLGYVTGWLFVAVVGDRDQSAFEFALGSMLVVYSAAARLPLHRLVPALATVLVVGGVASWLTYGPDDAPIDVLVPLLLLAGSFAGGREVRHHSRRANAAEQAVDLAEREREQRVATATATERTRIARELHDVVAHGVSVMGLQAAGIRSTLTDAEPGTTEALRSIEETGRATLEELHLMLGVLRSDESPSRGPVPRLAQLAELCAGAEHPPVLLRTEGQVRPLSPALELSAYRIVQEAVTNARRHASASRIEVTVSHGGDALSVDVRDDGDGAAPDWEPGHGLVGIEERARLHGGSAHVETAPGSGFRLRVVLPDGDGR
jgi:signal transduction histidine kinase